MAVLRTIGKGVIHDNSAMDAIPCVEGLMIVREDDHSLKTNGNRMASCEAWTPCRACHSHP